MNKKVFSLCLGAVLLLLASCGGSETGHFNGNGVFGKIPELMMSGVELNKKYMKEKEPSVRYMSFPDNVRAKSEFLDSNVDKDALEALKAEKVQVYDKLANVQPKNETPYKMDSGYSSNICIDADYGMEFKADFVIYLAMGKDQFNEECTPYYVFWDKDGKYLFGGYGRQDIKARNPFEELPTFTKWTFTCAFSPVVSDLDDFSLSRDIKNLEDIDKAASLSVVTKDRYNELEASLNKSDNKKR